MKQIQVPDQSLKKLVAPGAKQTQFSCEELDQCAVHFGVQVKEGGKYKSKKKLFEDIQAAAKKQGVQAVLPQLRLKRALMELGYTEHNINEEELFYWDEAYEEYWGPWARDDRRAARDNPELEAVLRRALDSLAARQPGLGEVDPLDWQFRYFEWVRVVHPALPEALRSQQIYLSKPEDMTDFDRQVMEIKYPGFYEKIDGIVDQVRAEAPYLYEWHFERAVRNKMRILSDGGLFNEADEKYGWNRRQLADAINASDLPIYRNQLYMLDPSNTDKFKKRVQSTRTGAGVYAFVYEAMRRFKENNPELAKLFLKKK